MNTNMENNNEAAFSNGSYGLKANPFDETNQQIKDEQPDEFGLFEAGDEESWNAALEAQRGGSRLSPERQNIVDQFQTLAPGQSFKVPVPVGEDADKYRASISNMLVQQGFKARKVMVLPGQNKLIIGIDSKKR